MSAENRIANFQMNRSQAKETNYDFLELQRKNIYGEKKQPSSYARLEKLKQDMASRGIAAPTHYLEEAYFSDEQA
jgi:hypothetical protein